MKDCEKCLNSRLIVSENGYHSICCLSQKVATDCMTDKKSQFVTLKRNEDGNIKSTLKGQSYMKKIYYCIVENIEVSDDLTDEDIESLIAEMSNKKDYMWSYEDNLLYE